MSLTARTREAREHADRTGDPGDEALAAALESALAADARELLSELRPDRDATGLPTPSQAGFVAEMRIPPGAAGN